jgi:hypothetical protein
MKELLTTALLCTILCAPSFTQIGKVGINTSSPAAMLHVKDSSVVFTSPYYENFPEYDAPPPVVGAGARLMWYPQRRSLRSGMVTGNQWDQSNTGFYSFASGYNPIAAGELSTALGKELIANGYSGLVIGHCNDPILNTPQNYMEPTTPLLIVGNGDNSGNRTNALVVLKNGRIGIGTNTPAARLHVEGESVLFRGPGTLPGTPGPPPVSGAGNRMMWYADKAAFRVGRVEGTQWDKDSIGLSSLAAGFNSIAKGENAIAFGNSTTARGLGAVALGLSTVAQGNYSTALGVGTIASGGYSIAAGYDAVASGNGSFALGLFAQAQGIESVAFGEQSLASGYKSMCFGYMARAEASHATAIGYESFANGQNAIALGDGSSAIGSSSVAIGKSTATIGDNAITLGFFTRAFGNNSIATGYDTKALGVSSFSSGEDTKASGDFAFSAGYTTTAKAYASFATGRFNDTTAISTTVWNTADPLFIIGNGSAHNARSNAVTVLKSGKTGIGTPNPINLLHLRAANDTINGPILSLGGTSADQAESGRIRFYEGTASTNLRGGYIHLDGAANRFHIGIHPTSDNIVSNDIDAISIDRASGEVGIGTANPNYLLEVNGTAGKPGGGSWTNSSDARLKQDIKPYEDGLQSILSIQPVRFHYNVHSGYDTSKEYVGVIAQELQEVAPYMVNTSARILPDGSTGYLDVDNSAMTYMLINAVKEQQAIIASQQDQIDTLEKEMQEIKALLQGVTQK